MIASLPFYDAPRLRPAWEQLWDSLGAALQREGVDAPAALSWPDDLEAHWRRDDLVLSQACGLDVVTRMADVLQPVAAWTFDLRGAGPGTYRSVAVVRDDHPARSLDDIVGLRLAANGPFSWSGAGCLRAAFGPLDDTFAEVHFVGSHAGAVAAVAAGSADVAVCDIVTWASLAGEREGLRVVGLTAHAPSPPLVIRSDADPAPVLRALSITFGASSSADVRAALRLKGFEPVTRASYRELAPFAPREGAPT